jgi:squalene-hopene cyclase-like protein/prenyltransferase/squalene oxidase-like repeat protein
MGLKLVAALVAALAVGGVPERAVDFLIAHRVAEGGFSEPGGRADPSLTAWVVLGLRAAREKPSVETLAYLRDHQAELESDALAVLALGRDAPAALSRLQISRSPNGRIGATLNSTFWGALALRSAGLPVPRASVRYILARQTPSGGWSWRAGSAPDSNDTAAALEALRAAGVSGRPIRRGVAFLRRFQNSDGGFALTRGRASDSQSSAWAIQAFVAAGKEPGRKAFSFLARMRRPDGSYRYSARYAITPVWVTAQVLPALSRKPFPLR